MNSTKRILVANDDPAVCKRWERALDAADCALTPALTGAEAVTRLNTDPPDLVLLELNMPEAGGWRAFERQCARRPWLPVIITAARGLTGPGSGRTFDVAWLQHAIRLLTGGAAAEGGPDSARSCHPHAELTASPA